MKNILKINSKYIKKFIEIIKLSKYLTEEHGAEFYFVYIPLYKSILNDEEFESMMETIVESKNKIEPHNREVSH